MAQTTISVTMPVAYAGMQADANDMSDVRTARNAEASTEMPFGIMVVKGTNDGDAILPAGGVTKPLGVVMHSHAYAKDYGTDGAGANTGELGTTGVKSKGSLNIMNKGRVWVLVEEAVVAEDRAFVRHTANGPLTQLGAFRKSADGGNAADVTKNARFVTSASAGALAMVEIDMMNA